MIIYGVTENLRNLLADQNFVQKYSSVPTERLARRSIWIGMLIYIPMTAVFLYIGTALFAFYSSGGAGGAVTKGDEAFPYFIATELPAGLKGLVLAAVAAAAMSTIDSGLNCSATVLLVDFYKRYVNPQVSDRTSLRCLRVTTVVWGLLGTGFAILMIRARSPGRLVADLRHLRRGHPRPVPAEPAGHPPAALAGLDRDRREHRRDQLGHLCEESADGVEMGRASVRPDHRRRRRHGGSHDRRVAPGLGQSMRTVAAMDASGQEGM